MAHSGKSAKDLKRALHRTQPLLLINQLLSKQEGPQKPLTVPLSFWPLLTF